MGVTTQVRHGEEGDAEAIALLVAELGYETSANAVRERLPLVRAAGGHSFVATIEGKVVGCLTTSLMQVLHRPAKVGRISLLVVEGNRRGAGIGTALVEAALKSLREDGCYIVEVTSRFELERAHRFYEGLGFSKTSVRLAYDL